VGADRAGFFASSTVPFAIADADGTMVDVNDAFAGVLGTPAAELIGESIIDLMHPEDREATAHRVAQLWQGEGGAVWINRYRTADGGWCTLRWSTWIDAERGLMCGVAQDVRHERDEIASLSRLAYDDQLTGLANRTRLLEAMGQLIGAPGSVGVLFLDVDGFKAVNDDHGHATGDTLLQQLGERLRGAVRRTDVLGRLGGDEFVVVLPDLPEEVDAVRVAVRAAAAQLLGALETRFEVADGVRLGGSVGAAACPWSGETPGDVLAAADAAMYEAKRAPGDGCVLHPTIA
jgi:diguanylate cyclase (GGDEF)-like protein/PAS domain S-box-containing protein